MHPALGVTSVGIGALAVTWVIVTASCSATGDATGFAAGGSSGATAAAGQGAGGDGTIDPGVGGGGGQTVVPDPKTCEEAAAAKSYVGCDFYPTVVDNIVWSLFDYAVVVANAGDTEAAVSVTRGGAAIASVTVPPNGAEKIYLPWVDELKTIGNVGFCIPTSVKLETARADGGAYHLVSSRPVTVYQFNALEYAGKGGPPGKDWSACDTAFCANLCFSYTNDASLLMPSTALTGTYRVTGMGGWPSESFYYPPYLGITGTQAGTTVTLELSSTASVVAGSGVPAGSPGGTVSFSLHAGDVVEVVGGSGSDFSGTLVKATAPVQVITGISCTNMPHETAACDHIEESVFPAETLGKRYFVTVPTSPGGAPIGHVVRLYGNVDGTKLTYPSGNPGGGPSVLSAGEVVDLGIVSADFEVVGDHELAVSSFQIGADEIAPGLPTNQQKGDPAQSLMTSVEQYRTKYVFLAPGDYDVSFIDVVQPLTAKLTLDGVEVAQSPAALGGEYGVNRIQLGPGNDGAHVLTATAQVGLQVMGYGTYTSYQYPGGLNLTTIAPIPPK